MFVGSSTSDDAVDEVNLVLYNGDLLFADWIFQKIITGLNAKIFSASCL